MTTASTQASLPVDQAVSAEVTSVETAGRWPLFNLIGSGIAWLLVSGVFGLIHAVQLRSPEFLAGCSVLTFGHVHAIEESTFIYGWIGNTGLGLTLWILGRLAAEPLRAPNWILAGTMFWNLGLLVGVVGIAVGDATSVPMLELPRYALPLMLVAYGAIGVAGVLAWVGRRREVMYVSHWYAAAALFLFPWLFSAAQVMLLWSPVRGTLQAVVGGWYAQGLLSLWISPLALVCAYYVVPRVKGIVLPAYDTATMGFWTLILIGAWTAGRHLIGGPVPVWISTVAIVTATALLLHFLVVFLNLRPAFRGGGLALRLIGLGLTAYIFGGIIDAVTAMRGYAALVEFTAFQQAQAQLALYGAVSLILFGTLYFAIPRVAGRPWASGGLVRAHVALTILGVVLLIVSLGAAGLVQSKGLSTPTASFDAIFSEMSVWLLGAIVANALLLFGNVLLFINFVLTTPCEGVVEGWMS